MTLHTFQLVFFYVGLMREVDGRKLGPFIFNHDWIGGLFVGENKSGKRQYSKKENNQSKERILLFISYLSKNFAYIIVKKGQVKERKNRVKQATGRRIWAIGDWKSMGAQKAHSYWKQGAHSGQNKANAKVRVKFG